MKKPLYLVLSLSAVIIAVILWEIAAFFTPGPLEKSTTIVFPPSTHFTTIADMLAENHVISHPLVFKIALVVGGQSSRIKAGEYAFPPHISEREVAYMLAFGKTVVHHFTVPEGLMTSEILQMLENDDLLAGEITLDVKEGELLPQTYNYSRDDKRNDMIERMRHAMQKTLQEAWDGREGNLPFETPQQALILASIVEKETGLAMERQHVASVYINRLRKSMLLQADPTTAYAVTGGKYKLPRPLTYDDLMIKSPFNTYKSRGLPPTPIANPGKASILAVLHPAQTGDLYFVATGTGGHNFARTPEEHSANVKKYRQVQKDNNK